MGSSASGGARAPPAPPTLVGTLGLAGEDLGHHSTCTPVAMAGSVTLDGDGRWMDDEGASGTSD